MQIGEEILRIYYKDSNHSMKLGNLLYSLTPRQDRPIIILSVGTDRSTGDSLGPFVGSYLKDHCKPQSIKIYGTLDEPIHAKNLHSKINYLYQRYKKPFIIAVDASLGKSSSIGFITCGKGPLKPGTAINKDLPSVGDLYITGIVNLAGFMEYAVLQSTRLSLVISMAKYISKGISLYDQKLSLSPEPVSFISN